MDATFLLEALKMGLSATATQAVKDSYNKVKMLLGDRLNDNSTAKKILAKYEQEPENKSLEKASSKLIIISHNSVLDRVFTSDIAVLNDS